MAEKEVLLMTDAEVVFRKLQKYRILPSKRPSLCKHPPPIFDDPVVHEYTLYIHTNGFSM